MYRWVRGFLDEHDLPGGVGAERLVGETGVVTVDIEPHDTDRRGRVTIGGEVWGALSKDDDASRRHPGAGRRGGRAPASSSSRSAGQALPQRRTWRTPT